MSEPAAATPLNPVRSKSTTNTGHITGQIMAKRKISTREGPLHLTLMRLAAADEYSHPATVELRSSSALGEPGDKWSGFVILGGMSNNYNTTNDEGEKVAVRSARNEYTVAE